MLRGRCDVLEEVIMGGQIFDAHYANVIFVHLIVVD